MGREWEFSLNPVFTNIVYGQTSIFLLIKQIEKKYHYSLNLYLLIMDEVEHFFHNLIHRICFLFREMLISLLYFFTH